MRRKHVSWKTRCAGSLASACPSCGYRFVPYEDTKQMTAHQLLSLFEWHHNIFHESGNRDRDAYWNLTPMLRAKHREQTKHDLRVIAKGRRIRKRELTLADAMAIGLRRGIKQAIAKIAAKERRRTGPPALVRRLRSRGFDKTRRRRMDGKVVPRE